MIEVAVVGAGHWGPNLIRNFHGQLRTRVRWAVELDAARRAEIESRFGDVRTTEMLDEALDDPAVDAVVVATPAPTHYAITRAAIERGKHVLVEKPITTDASQAADLCERARSANTILMVGHVFIYNPGVQRLKTLYSAGEIGRLLYMTMRRTNLGPIRVDVNAAWDLATHDVSIANFILGSEPVTVTGVGGTWINPGIEDAVFATLRYHNDVLVQLHSSWLDPRKIRQITLVGDRRMLTFDDMDMSEPIRIYDMGVADAEPEHGFVDTFSSFRSSIRQGDITVPRIAMGEPLKAECDHFIDCIEFGKDPLTTGWDGLATVRVLEAIERSIKDGGRETAVAEVTA